VKRDVCGFIFAKRSASTSAGWLTRRINGNSTPRKETIAVKEGLVLQHVHGSDDQIRAIMEQTGAEKDAPVIRELLDEALGARRRKAMGIADWEQPPGLDDKETFNTISVLLLKLLKPEERSFMARDIGLLMLREILIETRACRDVVFEEFIRDPWLAKGKTRETMRNFYDMHTRTATEKVEKVIKTVKKKASERAQRSEADIDRQLK
jgi:hypothetical protein